jgi:hypothetical protein
LKLRKSEEDEMARLIGRELIEKLEVITLYEFQINNL